MTQPLPAATALRSTWEELPHEVRAEVEEHLGTAVRGAASQDGGFTGGVAARLTLADATTAFVKALPTGHELAPDYRMEARVAGALPPEVPASRLRYSTETEGWIVLLYDDIEGRHPDLAHPTDLTAVLTCVERMTTALTPNPLPWAAPITTPLGPLLQGWHTFQQDGPPATSTPGRSGTWTASPNWRATGPRQPPATPCSTPTCGTTTSSSPPHGTAVAVDWAWACTGANWVELVYLLPAVAAAGADPEQIAAAHPLTRRADPKAIDAFICALAGLYTHSGRQPAPSWSPHIRTHETWYGRLCRTWLARRTGWS
ncbi:hypothetical protein [Streptomyces sp. NPDC018352]|uniref:hypothetical protein n=1 Tax=Streptomyces sp. NPDC018352 TaxID=3157194 RepID=UPI0033E4A8B5